MYSPETPLEWTVWLPPLRDNGVIKALQALGKHKLGDIFIDGVAKTWEDIEIQEEGATIPHRFQFYRVRGALKKELGAELIELPEVKEFTHLIMNDSPKRNIANIYRITITHRITQYTKARLGWQKDLNTLIDDSMWQYCCSSTKRISLHGKHRLLHFNS